ncbi:hypothetical protein C2869_20500 [Saccharobesus litoralis]|uniref:Cadherin domain-containing protein n=1 Tax=Saccharobesus litoralis TaxID=2172099 RepID=A0A2S0VWN4_9ALTE|nr:VCBS domain-containing protein [Saccharobesus litoralis]AWB68628.1 hypothetical protein C2869_20500 [Saccharobesus litoralis]
MNKVVFAASAIMLALAGCKENEGNFEEYNGVSNSSGKIEFSSDSNGLIDDQPTLSVVVNDDNGITEDIVYTWKANGFVLDDVTGPSYTLTSDDKGKKFTVQASYRDDDKFFESPTTVEIVAKNKVNPAEISGSFEVNSTNDVVDSTLSGKVFVSDLDEGEAVFVEQASIAASYGSFSIDATGAWTYVLDQSNAAVAALKYKSDDIKDSVVVTTPDGTTANLLITITGSEDAVPVTKVPTKVAKIEDTQSDDAGELRYKFGQDYPQGKLTARIKKPVNPEGKDAYVTIFNSSTSTSNALIDLRIHNDSFEVRDKSDVVVTAAFTPDEWIDVEMTWDGSTSPATMTLTINGQSVPAFSSASSNGENFMRTIAFKLGDNGSTLTSAYYVDDIKVYSDVAGTTEIFSDNFESYTIGDVLGTEHGYNSATNEVTVDQVEIEVPVDPGTGNGGGSDTPNNIVEIKDTQSDDAGELRYKFDQDYTQGKLTARVRKPENPEGKDAYVTIFNSSTSTSNALVDLRIHNDSFEIRDKSDVTITTAFVADEWIDVEMTWDGSTTPATIGVTINGESVTSFASASSNAEGFMRTIAFKLGDNGSTLTSSYYVDDIKVYSDIAGTTEIFSDDFEGYTDGQALGTSQGYNSATNEAAVVTVGGNSGSGNSGNNNGGSSGGSTANKAAKISDTMSDDAGELRYKFDQDYAQGKLTARVRKPENPEGKDAYVTIFNSSTSTSNALVDLRIHNDSFEIRDKGDITVTTAFTADAWIDVEMTWDSSTTPATITVTINGETITGFASASSNGEGFMRTIAFKLGDNGSTLTSSYYVDDIKVYSDLAGTTEIFSDDFEGYTLGDVLGTEHGYNSATNEVVVAEK